MTPASLEQDPSSGALGTEPGNMESGVADGIAQSPCSDNDGGERPVRQQLKATNLDASIQNNINKKRSHDESDNDATSEADAPPKKRSRECTPETSSRSQDTSSLQNNGSKKRSLNDSDNDATSEIDAPPKKRSRECTPENSAGAQEFTSFKPSGAEQPETETAPAGTLSPNVSLPSLPDYEDSPSPMEPLPPILSPLPKRDGSPSPLEPLSPVLSSLLDYQESPISRIQTPVLCPLSVENPLEKTENHTIPDGSVEVKSENENDGCGEHASSYPEHVELKFESSNDNDGEDIRPRPCRNTITPENSRRQRSMHAVVSMVNLHNHNIDQGRVDGLDKSEDIRIWVGDHQPSMSVSINASPTTPNAPDERHGELGCTFDAQIHHHTVHCEATVTITIEGQAQIPIKVPFDINLSIQELGPPAHEELNDYTESTCPSILRGCPVSTPDSRLHAAYGHRPRYSDYAAHYPASPSHISITSDEDTPENDVSSHISISSDEESLHGDILPSSQLPRTPECTTHADPSGFEPINNTIFSQESERPPATKESSKTQTVSSDGTLTAEGKPQKTTGSDEQKNKMNSTFSSSAFGNTSTDSPFSSAFKSSTTSTSAFGSSMASTSATSPFATLSATTKEPAVANNSSYNNKPASTSAFASSSLSAFAGSDNSPFGSLAAGSSTGFSAFSSAFPATGKPGGLTSFASPNVTSSFGDSKAKTQSLGVKSKALGAAQSDNEDSDNEQEEENNGNDTFVAEKTDERFVAQPVETGEEDEETIFANKGKLYCFDNKQWKERGVGTFKVNVKLGPDGKQTARMIMRADGALRVMLNSAIFKGMHFGDQQGEAPAGRRIFLASKEDGKVANVLLQLNNENTVNELYATLKDLLEED